VATVFLHHLVKRFERLLYAAVNAVEIERQTLRFALEAVVAVIV